MAWFHFTKQERFRRNREIRREIAEAAKKSATENIFLVPHDITPALSQALDEERTFEEYFGEKMPAHLRDALSLEITFWQHLHQRIAGLHAEQLTTTDYDRIKEAVRAYLVVLIDLLHAEEEMVTSCLQLHFREITADLQARAAKVPL